MNEFPHGSSVDRRLLQESERFGIQLDLSGLRNRQLCGIRLNKDKPVVKHGEAVSWPNVGRRGSRDHSQAEARKPHDCQKAVELLYLTLDGDDESPEDLCRMATRLAETAAGELPKL